MTHSRYSALGLSAALGMSSRFLLHNRIMQPDDEYRVAEHVTAAPSPSPFKTTTSCSPQGKR